jgi:hypothetical protein
MVLSVALVVAPAAAAAQDWEIEVHGGSLFTPEATGGSGTLPAGGASFTTFGTFQSRRVSSWLYGDGAQLLNGIATAFNIQQRVTPLDPVANNLLADRRGGASAGFRVSRSFTSRLAAEFNFDYASTPLQARVSAASGLSATTTSFRAVFQDNNFVPPVLFVGKTVTASSSLVVPDGSEVIATGAVRFDLLTRGPVRPYVTGGAGVTRHRGDFPVATAEGAYTFRFLGVSPIDERDRVTLTQTFDESVAVGVFGGGVSAFLSRTSGIRVDVRVHVGETTDRVLLDATPTVTVAAQPTSVFSLTNPSISWNSFPQPSATPPSSLSGPSVNDHVSFEVSRTRSQVVWSVGYFYRF